MSKFYLNPDADWTVIITNIVAAIKALPKDKRWQVVIELFKDTRSQQQNRYLWSVVYATVRSEMREQGEDHIEEIWHEHFKEQFLPPQVSEVMGGEVKLYRSTTKLTKKQFAEYLEHLFRFAGENCFQIPPPDWNWQQRSVA